MRNHPRDLNGFTYSGDLNLQHGGIYVRVDGTSYADVVEVSDLDSAIGYADAYLIESGSVPFQGDRAARERTRSALSTVGLTMADLRALPRAQRRFELARALWVYGFRDSDRQETVTMGAKAAESFDGWNADTRLRANANLARYVESEFLA